MQKLSLKTLTEQLWESKEAKFSEKSRDRTRARRSRRRAQRGRDARELTG